MAGDETVWRSVPVDAALGTVGRSAGARGARSDVRHAGDLFHRDVDRDPRRSWHRDLPDRALSAVAASPDRNSHRIARRDSIDHLRHVGLLRAWAVPGLYVPAFHDAPVRRCPASWIGLRRPAFL